MLKYTLVPEEFFEPSEAASLLAQAVQLKESEEVKYQELPAFKAVLVYVPEGQGRYLIEEMAGRLPQLKDYNKYIVSWDGSCLSAALAAGERLLLVNSFRAEDEVTAEYWIFAVLKQFQLNPQVTVVNFLGEVPYRMQNDLARYFKGVETL